MLFDVNVIQTSYNFPRSVNFSLHSPKRSCSVLRQWTSVVHVLGRVLSIIRFKRVLKISFYAAVSDRHAIFDYREDNLLVGCKLFF